MTRLAFTARPSRCMRTVPVKKQYLITASFSDVLLRPSSDSPLHIPRKHLLFRLFCAICSAHFFRTKYDFSAIKTLTPEQTALFDLHSTTIIFCGEKGCLGNASFVHTNVWSHDPGMVEIITKAA